ncbi:hypothetical protein IT157_09880 [bacterium]|nr:hypothetical protein [bacterium]
MKRERVRAARMRVSGAVERMTGWYLASSMKGYIYLQTGERPASLARDRLRLAVVRLKEQRTRVLNRMRRPL